MMKKTALSLGLAGAAFGASISVSAVASAATPVVITFDTETMEAGVAGSQTPSVVVPAIAATLRTAPTYTTVYGDAAQNARDVVSITHPVSGGEVVNWTVFQGLVSYVITTKLGLSPANVLLFIGMSRPSDNPRPFEDMAFGGLQVAGACVAVDPVLALYASGRTTGVVVEMDADVTGAYAVYQGYANPRWGPFSMYGQTQVLSSLSSMLAARGITVSLASQRSWLQGISDQAAYVAASYASEMQKPASSITQNVTLPNGTTIALASERFRTPELLFQPTAFGVTGTQLPLDQLVYDAASTSGQLSTMAGNIILAGTDSLYPGLSTRLASALTAMGVTAPKIVASPNRKYQAWIGGSVVASASSFANMWMTPAQYAQLKAGTISQPPQQPPPPPTIPPVITTAP